MAIAKVRVEHAEQDRFDRQEGDEQRALELRPSARDVADFRLFWREFPERAGLASNMASSIARLEQLSHRDVERVLGPVEEKKARRKRPNAYAQALTEHLAEKETPAETLARRATEAATHFSAPIDLPPDALPEMRPVRARRRFPRTINGVVVARGYQPETMTVKADGGGGSLRMVPIDEDTAFGRVTGLVGALFDAEAWVETANRKDASRVRLCGAGFVAMIAQGDSELVGHLYRMYGGSHPAAAEDGEFREELGPKHRDLAPLVLDTEVVLDHAALMTRKLRKQLADDSWVSTDPQEIDRCQRHETVTPLEAARDLLKVRHGGSPEREERRVEATNAVRQQAGRLLLVAYSSYRKLRWPSRPGVTGEGS